MKSLVLGAEELGQRTQTVRSQPGYATALGLRRDEDAGLPLAGPMGVQEEAPAFQGADLEVAQLAWAELRRYETQPDRAPTTSALLRPDIQAAVLAEVERRWRPAQLDLGGGTARPDFAAVVAKASELVVEGTIDIPRILVTPMGEVRSGYRPFALDLSSVRPLPEGGALWLQELRTGAGEALDLGRGAQTGHEARLEDYIVRRLIDYPDVAYDQHADLLYDLAGQVVAHLRAKLSDEEVADLLRARDESLAKLVHSQMQAHYEEGADAGYEVVVRRGWTELKTSAFTAAEGEEPLNFRAAPSDKSNMARYLFGGFRRCLYPTQKFQSDAERRLAVILDRDSRKWFKPSKGQFQIYYRRGPDHPEYLPDFVAETDARIYMLEPKATDQMSDPEVEAKEAVARTWCDRASRHADLHGGKPWSYALIPHDRIVENMSLDQLASLFTHA